MGNCSCANNNTTRCNNISSTIINGSPEICASSSQSYSLSNNFIATWSLTTGSNLASIQGNNIPSSGPIVVSNSNSTGTVVLNAYVAACDANITKSITLGTPSPIELTFNGFGYNAQNAGTTCIGGEADYEVSVVNPIFGASYWWTVSGADFRFGQGYPEAGITIGNNPSGYVGISVQPENTCGLGNSFSLALQICDDGLRMQQQQSNLFKISPNPATNVITIQYDVTTLNQKTKKQANATSITEVKILDNLSNLRKLIKYGTGTRIAQINVADLKTGLYFVEISYGQNKERQQLIIRK